jgi:hypothetical protein
VDEETLRRIVREEVRAALADMLPAEAGPMLTYKQALEKFRSKQRQRWSPEPVPKDLTYMPRDIVQMVERGRLRAVRVGNGPPRIALSEIERYTDHMRHTAPDREEELRAHEEKERVRWVERRKKKA